MRIGVHASNTRDVAGQFQFLIMFLDSLFTIDTEHDVYLFYFRDENKLSQEYQKKKWHWIDLKKELKLSKPDSRLKRLFRRFSKKTDSAPKWMPKLKEALLRKYKLDFIFFPVWTDRCWEWGVPFGFAVHDVQHRLQPEFPEVSVAGRWAWREMFFFNATRLARVILVDSEEGKRNILQFYDCRAEKIKVLSRAVPSSSRIKIAEDRKKKIIEKLNIPRKFLFYPAQFWLHKNHYRIVEAIGMLKRKRGVEVSIVFVGKSWPEWQISAMNKTLAKRHSVEKQIYHFGYVNDEELVALYMVAAGLVMPTFFGPTNLPYLEAFYHKCPVIASDIPGIREQVGEAALLVDPKNTGSISEAMYNIWTDENLRQRLIERGEQRLKEFAPERFQAKLDSIIKGLACNTQK